MLKEWVHRSSGSSLVSVMRSAELWDGNDSSGCWLHSPGCRSVLAARKMSSRIVIVRKGGCSSVFATMSSSGLRCSFEQDLGHHPFVFMVQQMAVKLPTGSTIVFETARSRTVTSRERRTNFCIVGRRKSFVVSGWGLTPPLVQRRVPTHR